MNYEEFERYRENGYFRDGDRFWIYEMHFGNVEGRISRHIAPMEIELSTHGYFYKVSPKTGRRLTTWVYASREAYHEGEFPDSRYVMQVFEHKEDCIQAYKNSVEFWKDRVEAYRQQQNDLLDRQLVYMQEYADKVE